MTLLSRLEDRGVDRTSSVLRGNVFAICGKTVILGFTTRYSVMSHAMQYDLDRFKDETAQIGEYVRERMEAESEY